MLLPRLFGWHIHQNDKFFLTFLVATHLGTALVLLGFFFEDWVRIVKGLWRSLAIREIRADDVDARLAWLLVAATIPVGVIGLLLETPLRKLFASAQIAALFLIINGIALLLFERLRKRPPREGDGLGDGDARIAKLSWRQAISRRRVSGRSTDPGDLAVGLLDGGGLAGRPVQRGCGSLLVPAGDAGDPRGGGVEAARTARLGGRRRSRPGPRRGHLCRRDDLLRRQVPAPILRDEHG